MMYTVATDNEGETQIINSSTGNPVARHVDAAFARLFACRPLHNNTEIMHYINELADLGYVIKIVPVNKQWLCYAVGRHDRLISVSGCKMPTLEGALESLLSELKEDEDA